MSLLSFLYFLNFNLSFLNGVGVAKQGMLHANFEFYLRSDPAHQSQRIGVVSAILVKGFLKKGLRHTTNFADFLNVAFSGAITLLLKKKNNICILLTAFIIKIKEGTNN